MVIYHTYGCAKLDLLWNVKNGCANPWFFSLELLEKINRKTNKQPWFFTWYWTILVAWMSPHRRKIIPFDAMGEGDHVKKVMQTTVDRIKTTEKEMGLSRPFTTSECDNYSSNGISFLPASKRKVLLLWV